ncbi:ferritin-like domain-containing protein [Aurantiacibacter zhengii]|uniref:PA2169 family four-helix-bundle protein n=1 Tax=Aurantiacibacter zhengii TaxID=2307003 RepID=A0A418NQA3_9SPHN|nr:PA2169 family four-helix-bundle protein [Aurantiacibacter zhengii]RIV84630.1 PA2169 family four-helix-bundle protein [Aurantiacibacter zhengii]
MSANSVLKTLTDTAFDSVEGYRQAAEKANNPQLKQALERRRVEREKTVSKLNAEIERQGGELVTKGTMTGSAHRTWMSIADAFENGDEAAAELVEEGEDYLKGKFKSALDDDDLDPQSRTVIQQCYAEISEGERFGDMIDKQFD